MEILVCIKQVPDDSVEILYDESKKGPSLDKVENVVNAFDTYALEMATRLKEANEGSNITVLSIGPESASNSLKNCLAVGGDEAYLMIADDYQVVDPLCISRNLSKAISMIEEKKGIKFDIVFCGIQSTDHSAGQVGLMLAKERDLAYVTNLVDISFNGSEFVAKEETDDGYNLVSIPVSSLVTVNTPAYEPRYPTIKSKMAARKKTIEKLEGFESMNSSYEVKEVLPKEKRKAGVKIEEEDVADTMKKAIDILVEAKVI